MLLPMQPQIEREGLPEVESVFFLRLKDDWIAVCLIVIKTENEKCSFSLWLVMKIIMTFCNEIRFQRGQQQLLLLYSLCGIK